MSWISNHRTLAAIAAGAALALAVPTLQAVGTFSSPSPPVSATVYLTEQVWASQWEDTADGFSSIWLTAEDGVAAGAGVSPALSPSAGAGRNASYFISIFECDQWWNCSEASASGELPLGSLTVDPLTQAWNLSFESDCGPVDVTWSDDSLPTVTNFGFADPDVPAVWQNLAANWDRAAADGTVCGASMDDGIGAYGVGARGALSADVDQLAP